MVTYMNSSARVSITSIQERFAKFLCYRYPIYRLSRMKKGPGKGRAKFRATIINLDTRKLRSRKPA